MAFYAPAMRRSFAQVDVFTAVPYRGNPLAVVADAEGLTAEEMQHFAAWTNLSETTFLLEPSAGPVDDTDNTGRADRANRADESDGSTQPTKSTPPTRPARPAPPTDQIEWRGPTTGCGSSRPTGSCRSPGTRRWARAGSGWIRAGVPRRPGQIIQECGAGLVTIRSDGDRLAFAAPPLVRSGPVSAEDLAAACALAGIDPDPSAGSVMDANWVENGPPWMGILLRSAEEVLALRPQAANPQDLFVGVVGPHPPGSAADSADCSDGCDFEVRAFFPKHGTLAEDPVTGSLNASLGQWLTAAGHATAPYTSSQGAALDRDGRVYIDQDPDGTIWVGGDVVTCIQGTVEI